MDRAAAVWPTDKLNALRLGRRLVAEVAARPGRRSFVDVTPIRDQDDATAQHEGWERPNTQRSFKVEQWDYDEQQMVGFDYDIGAERIRVATATDEIQLLEVVGFWGLQPREFKYPWDTADPR
jgi:hypothetical protein